MSAHTPPWHPTPTPARRGPDGSAFLSLALAVPGLLCGLLAMALVGEVVVPAAPWLVPALWLVSGAVMFARPTELLVAKLVLDVRRPTPAELHKLAPAWASACGVAGVDAGHYLLYVEDSDQPSAFAAGGRIVTVTRAALHLPPPQLEAVLAHELAHHLSAHTTVAALTWWYSLPARGVAFVLRLTVRFVLAIGRAMADFGSALSALASVLLGLLLLTGLALISVWLLLVPLVSPLLAWASRLGELRADRTAQQLGYGPALVEVLRYWTALEGPQPRPRPWHRLTATHPPHADRIRRLQAGK